MHALSIALISKTRESTLSFFENRDSKLSIIFLRSRRQTNPCNILLSLVTDLEKGGHGEPGQGGDGQPQKVIANHRVVATAVGSSCETYYCWRAVASVTEKLAKRSKKRQLPKRSRVQLGRIVRERERG